MPENVRSVSIGEIIVSKDPNDVLVAYGLGSCVAICLYDSLTHVGGMLHALLPEPTNGRVGGNPAKFVEQGVPLLIQSVVEMGASRIRLKAQFCGGAQMLSAPGFSDSLNIGQRNVVAAEGSLKKAGTRITSKDTGGHIGRTARLTVADGAVIVTTRGKDEKSLA